MSAPDYQHHLHTETSVATKGPTVSGKYDIPNYFALVKGVLDPLIPHSSSIALFDFPNYANVGDSLIWLGEEAYLKDRGDLRISVVDDLTVPYRRSPDVAFARLAVHQWRLLSLTQNRGYLPRR